jgi:transcriptional regulator GlxA family with amidase domain
VLEATEGGDTDSQILTRLPTIVLTEVLRLHVAKDLLAPTTLGVGAVARRVRYDSEEAFSRAFKRAHGRAPAHWRADRSSN